MYHFLLDPPNLNEDQFFDWSQRVEPKNMESLIAQFISDEIKMNKVRMRLMKEMALTTSIAHRSFCRKLRPYNCKLTKCL